MPLVQRIISEFLPSSEVLTSIPGDEVIAIGAAKEVWYFFHAYTRQFSTRNVKCVLRFVDM